MRPSFRRILVPVELSSSSCAALEYAGYLGAMSHATIDVLHVWDPEISRWEALASLDPSLQRLFSLERSDGGRALKAALDRIAHDSRIVLNHHSFECGDPASLDHRDATEAVLTAATTWTSDAIVIGANHTSHSGMAEIVTRLASCPVIAVREEGLS